MSDNRLPATFQPPSNRLPTFRNNVRTLTFHPPCNVQICWGCKHTLELMASGDTVFGSYYAHEPGGSPSWLFQVCLGVPTSVSTCCSTLISDRGKSVGCYKDGGAPHTIQQRRPFTAHLVTPRDPFTFVVAPSKGPFSPIQQ